MPLSTLLFMDKILNLCLFASKKICILAKLGLCTYSHTHTQKSDFTHRKIPDHYFLKNLLGKKIVGRDKPLTKSLLNV